MVLKVPSYKDKLQPAPSPFPSQPEQRTDFSRVPMSPAPGQPQPKKEDVVSTPAPAPRRSSSGGTSSSANMSTPSGPVVSPVPEEQVSSPAPKQTTASRTSQSQTSFNVITGSISPQTDRGRLEDIKFQRSQLEQSGRARDTVRSAGLAFEEILLESGVPDPKKTEFSRPFPFNVLGFGVPSSDVARSKAQSGFNVPTLPNVKAESTGFEFTQRQTNSSLGQDSISGADSFKNIKSLGSRTVSAPVRGAEFVGGNIGSTLQQDPVKGGVLIGLDVATLVVPVTGLRGGRLATSSIKSPSRPVVSKIGDGPAFKLSDEVGSTLVIKTPNKVDIKTVSGQTDLFGGIAKTPEPSFRPGQFVPVGPDPVTGKLKFVEPFSPELRSGTFNPLVRPAQQPLTAPTVGFKDPVFVTDTFSGKTRTVEANVLVDFLSEQPGRFTDVRRPSPGLTLDPVIKRDAGRQTVLSPETPNTPFFATLFPVPVQKFDFGSSGLTGASSKVLDVKDVGVGVIRSPSPSLASESVSSGFKAFGFSPSVSSGFGDKSVFNAVSVSSKSGVVSSTGIKEAQVTSNALISEGLTSTSTIPKSISSIGSASATRSVSRSRTAISTVPRTTGLTASVTTPKIGTAAKTGIPRRPPRIRTPFALPNISIDRTRRSTSRSTLFKSFSAGTRSIRTASPSRDFIISPGRTNAGMVKFVREGKKGEAPKRKRKDKFGFSSSFSFKVGGLGL